MLRAVARQAPAAEQSTERGLNMSIARPCFRCVGKAIAGVLAPATDQSVERALSTSVPAGTRTNGELHARRANAPCANDSNTCATLWVGTPSCAMNVIAEILHQQPSNRLREV